MGKLKGMYTDIQDMILNGYDHEDISTILGVPRDLIKEVDNTIDAELEASYDSPERWEL
jgi:hypothetical protein